MCCKKGQRWEQIRQKRAGIDKRIGGRSQDTFSKKTGI